MPATLIAYFVMRGNLMGAVLDDALEAAEVAAPHRAQHRLGGERADAPPIQIGKVSSSVHVKRVRPRRRRRRVKRPRPVTAPRCSMPIARPGVHSVTAMRSVVRSGPTFVTQSKRVPTPRREVLVNVIDSASAIQST